ncbi:hypothetical protein CapIbe_000941 [Capra ibex]
MEWRQRSVPDSSPGWWSRPYGDGHVTGKRGRDRAVSLEGFQSPESKPVLEFHQLFGHYQMEEDSHEDGHEEPKTLREAEASPRLSRVAPQKPCSIAGGRLGSRKEMKGLNSVITKVPSGCKPRG